MPLQFPESLLWATSAWSELARVMPPPHNHGQPEPDPLSFFNPLPDTVLPVITAPELISMKIPFIPVPVDVVADDFRVGGVQVGPEALARVVVDARVLHRRVVGGPLHPAALIPAAGVARRCSLSSVKLL
jgi:hypothetical protein